MCGCGVDGSHPGIECGGAGCYCHHEWPCDRRDAHGPHPVGVCTCASTEGSLMTCEVHGVAPASEEDKSGWCPGVGAHPATMIGRNDVEGPQ